MWLGRLARGALLPRARLVAPPLIEAKPLLRSAQSGGATLRRLLSTSTGTASGESGGAGGVGGALKSWAQFGLSLGAFVAADQLLKKSLKEAGVSFPASLVGMFGILGGLLGLAAAGRLAAAEMVIGAASPAMAWVQRYLPVFYTPPLIVPPLDPEHAHAHPSPNPNANPNANANANPNANANAHANAHASPDPSPNPNQVLPLAVQSMSSSDLMYIGGILLAEP